MSMSSADTTLRKSIMSLWWTGVYLHPRGSHLIPLELPGVTGNHAGPLLALMLDTVG